MANIIRSAKSGGDWTHFDIVAHNIRLSYENATTFFGVAQLPAPIIDNEILAVEKANDTASDANYHLLSLLDMTTSSPRDSVVDEFALFLFHAMGYVHRPRVTLIQQELPLRICGESKYAKPDVSILDRNMDDIILLVQEDKRFSGGPTEAYAQLIAGAIATYQRSQIIRITSGLPSLQSLVRNKSILITSCTNRNARSSQASYWLGRIRRFTKSPSPKNWCNAWNWDSTPTPRPLWRFIFLISRDHVNDGSKA